MAAQTTPCECGGSDGIMNQGWSQRIHPTLLAGEAVITFLAIELFTGHD